MYRCFTPLLIGFAILASSFGSDIRLAVFDVDASPPIGSPLAYDPTIEIQIPLRCRGIVLQGNEAPVVLCSLDWIGLGNASHRAFREHLAKACNTTVDRVAVHTIHQHDAPWCDMSMDNLLVDSNLANRPFDSLFARKVMENAAQAAAQAMALSQPVTHLGTSSASVEKVASSRRILGPDGKVLHVRWTATTDPEVRAFPEGTIDPKLQMITFWNDRQPLVAMTYYATHPQSYYRTGKANPDFPGMARNARQEATGVMHIHFNGAGGNVSAGKYNDGAPENRQILADRMADAMRRAWENVERKPVTSSSMKWESVSAELPVARHLKAEELEGILQNAESPVAQKLVAAGKLVWLRRCLNHDRIDIGCLSIDNVRVLHMPGELFVEYQLEAQRLRPDLVVAMAAYGDYGPAYIGTRVSYDQGGYETGPDASFVAPEVESTLMSTIATLLGVDAAQVRPLQ